MNEAGYFRCCCAKLPVLALITFDESIMFAIISPAKSLDFDSPLNTLPLETQPRFLSQTQQLVDELKKVSPQAMAKLMKISDKLALLNVERLAVWQPSSNDNSVMRAAAFAYSGDTYQGLAIEQFSNEQLLVAQNKLRIVSGLYGLLRPLDRICAYRLEMKISLAVNGNKNLYRFWEETLTQSLQCDMDREGAEVLLNLASTEYASAINPKTLGKTIVTPVFEDEKSGSYKVIGFYAKRARGTMAAWMVKNNISKPEQLIEFDGMGYHYVSSLSTPTKPVFRRESAS